MMQLVLGLVLFLGVHSVRIVADDWRTSMRARTGEMPWKGAYSLVSAVGLGLIIWGVSLARENPVVLWSPPPGMRHAAALLTCFSLVLIAAAYVPGNKIKTMVHHPMTLGIKVWAFAHLLANGMVMHVVLFGSFLAWAVLTFVAARRRDRAAQVVYAAGNWGATVVTVAMGTAAWWVFAMYLHGLLIGVRPMG